MPRSTTSPPEDDTSQADPPPEARRGRSRSATTQRWTRILHAYTSMAALLLVLFFGATGLTLNHPEWDLGFDTTRSEVTGDLPADAVGEDGAVELLALSEHLRAAHGVRGEVTEFGSTDGEGFISYRGPGYAAEARFDSASGTYALTSEQQGVVGVLNDLHKGRDTTSSWSWLIDAAAVFLVVISLTGLVLQLVLRRRRTSALVLAGAGGAVAVALGVITLA